MLPDSQQQQNLRHIGRLAPLSPFFSPRFRKLGGKGVSPEEFAARSNQEGFTVVEALLAIIVVAILMVGVAPVLVLATANRVQAKRVGLAVNAAKYYIDSVRSDPSLTPPIDNRANFSSARYFDSIDPPRAGGNLLCNATDVNFKGYCRVPEGQRFKVFCVDGDGDNRCTKDSLKDMLVQAFGYQKCPASNPSGGELRDQQKAQRGYQLGLRVYRADAFQDGGSLKKSSRTFTNTTKALARTTTGGLGARKAPLVEMTTQITTNETKYEDLSKQFDNTCQ